MKKYAFAALAALGTLASVAPASAAIMLGDTIELAYLFPDTSSVYQTNTGTFTGSLTLPIIYTGTATFFANSFTLTQDISTYYTPASFNGVRITDLSNASAFDGWAELPGATGPNPHTTTFSGGSVFVNWQGAPFNVGDQITIAGVPEPMTWALMIVGFGMVGAAMRRRQTATVTYA